MSFLSDLYLKYQCFRCCWIWTEKEWGKKWRPSPTTIRRWWGQHNDWSRPRWVIIKRPGKGRKRENGRRRRRQKRRRRREKGRRWRREKRRGRRREKGRGRRRQKRTGRRREKRGDGNWNWRRERNVNKWKFITRNRS